MAAPPPCLACACNNPRLLSDVLDAIHLKRGQVRSPRPRRSTPGGHDNLPPE